MSSLSLPEPDEFIEAAKDKIDEVEGVFFSTGAVYGTTLSVILEDDSIYEVEFKKVK